MLLWPALTLLGFLGLTAFVIALGTRSTARYEREQQVERQTAPEPRRVTEPAPAARAA